MEKENVFTRLELQRVILVVVLLVFVMIAISYRIGYDDGEYEAKRSLAHKAEYLNMLRDLDTYHTGRELDSILLSHEQDLVKSIDSAFKAK